eukprot:FR734705.1.p1 GENE.FR734705.1~~FR734705.1.p1  ORF type:complete len:192 (+),score=30.31 FR734705.1:2-577(+)
MFDASAGDKGTAGSSDDVTDDVTDVDSDSGAASVAAVPPPSLSPSPVPAATSNDDSSDHDVPASPMVDDMEFEEDELQSHRRHPRTSESLGGRGDRGGGAELGDSSRGEILGNREVESSGGNSTIFSGDEESSGTHLHDVLTSGSRGGVDGSNGDEGEGSGGDGSVVRTAGADDGGGTTFDRGASDQQVAR